jgi:hypothetical protein
VVWHLSVYWSVYQTASARWDQLMFGWDRSFVYSITMLGWSASHSFTLASRLSNCGFLLPELTEKTFNFMMHPSLGESQVIDATRFPPLSASMRGRVLSRAPSLVPGGRR